MSPFIIDSSRAISVPTVTPRHYLNVKPGGNQLISSADPSIRLNSMGVFASFPDELIMDLLSYLTDAKSLLNLSHTSKFMYAYLFDDEVWKKIYLNKKDDSLPWYGSWRSTVLGIKEPMENSLFQIPENALCSDVLYRPFQCSQIDYETVFHNILEEEAKYNHYSTNVQPNSPLIDLPHGRIPRIPESCLSLQDFNTNWHNKPFILTNNDPSRWTKWDLDSLLNRFPDVKFRQESMQWPLQLYADYMKSNKDESPLYLFDCSSPAMKQLRKEYEAPSIFQQDLFTLFGDCRPDYAWLIIGPKRSGSTFHKDPNYTSAWNTALVGRKLWIMFPPNIVPPGVSTDEEESEVTSPVGLAEWVISGFFNDCLKVAECQVAVTFPGECMYVPSGWWHSVINIDDGIALTQNFVPISKLANALNFLKNKKNQVSGFRLKEILKAIQFSKNTTLIKYKDLINDLDASIQDEDCGEIAELPDMPIFELFMELLSNNGYSQELELALKELEKIERKSHGQGKSKVWENLEQDKQAGFSFGFNDSEDDE